MKIAVLLMVHGSPSDGLLRSLSKINHDDICFFIHVDKKSDIYGFKTVLEDLGNVYFLPNERRVKVNWGGRSQVDAMLSLMLYSYDFDVFFDRFIFLSGSDYPLCNGDQLIDYCKSTSCEIGRIDRVITDENDNKIRPLSLHDIGFLNPRNVKEPLSFILYIFLGVLRKIKTGTLPKGINLVHGSSSFCFTRAAIARVKEFYCKDLTFYKSLKYSFSADEIYFHSILYSSGFVYLHDYTKSEVESDKKCIYGIHYINWCENIKSPPKNLGLEDINDITSISNIFFARKVDLSDTKLLDRFDAIPSNN